LKIFSLLDMEKGIDKIDRVKVPPPRFQDEDQILRAT